MKFSAIALICLFSVPFALFAANRFEARDHPSDDGTAIDLIFSQPYAGFCSGSTTGNQAGSAAYWLEKQDSAGVWVRIMDIVTGAEKYTDSDNIVPGKLERYRLVSTEADNTKPFVIQYTQVIPTAQWFNYYKSPLLFMILLLCGAVIYYIISARRGRDLFIRRINGLESMDEAVGRATEKGKPILFVPGIGDLDDIQTIAGLTILSQLAYKAATYNADLLVPVSKSMVLSTAREVVKEAYLKAGKPDMYNPDSVFYLTDDQFGYVAGIDGIMVREKPAANFFLGTFYAESLILAETGFATGAMQTAGTAQPSQLPFFVVSCDYTLIGEELFAASAYLSKAPDQLGSLKGQDFGKLFIVGLILLGIVLEITGHHWLKTLLTLE